MDGGGYSAGTHEQHPTGRQNKNGVYGYTNQYVDTTTGATKIYSDADGGCYFETQLTRSGFGGHAPGECSYGDGYKDNEQLHFGSSGGIAGSGGTVTVSSTATINAINGNRYTDGSGFEACPIYAQTPSSIIDLYIMKGYATTLAFYNRAKILVGWKTSDEIDLGVDPISNGIEHEYKIPKEVLQELIAGTTYGQGIGSGAGYIEFSNGTYLVD